MSSANRAEAEPLNIHGPASIIKSGHFRPKQQPEINEINRRRFSSKISLFFSLQNQTFENPLKNLKTFEKPEKPLKNLKNLLKTSKTSNL